MKRKLLAILMILTMTLTTRTVSFASAMSELPQPDNPNFIQQGEEEPGTMPAQLTEEDIAAMNDGNVLITYSDEGYVSTIVGKYYEGIVQDQEDAIESIKGLALLLGLGMGSEFFCVYGGKDGNGYTYWTFQQRYGGYTLQFATLRVIVDPEGYTAGLTCSFVPNVGIAQETDVITAEQAQQIVLDRFPDQTLNVMPEYTQRLAVQFNNRAYNCYAVYTNNPEMTVSFNMPYYEHYVTTDGIYVTRIATNSLATSNEQAYKAEEYFIGLEMTSYSKIVKSGDGMEKQIEVPIAYNPKDGLYYLADADRKIMVAQYYDFYYQGNLNFVTSKTNDGWSDNNLLAYDNYCKAYDFYESHGITSVDDFGTPILVTVGYCDENRKPVDNACYYGNNLGWICFAVSDANTYSDALDVCAHEFTHAVTGNSMQGTAYYNEYGAINESYSDIMGNLCEMMTGETDDKDWLVGEKSGAVMRNMGAPNKYQQPGFVGDMYYVPPVAVADSGVNDNGGVHVNNSLLGHIAYELDRAGMNMEDQCRLWLGTIEMITPFSDYDDLHALLLFSGEINGIEHQYLEKINELFASQGLNGDRQENAKNAQRSGYGHISFTVDEAIRSSASVCLFINSSNEVVASTCPDAQGLVCALLPQGIYGAIYMCKDASGKTAYAGYTSYGWSPGQNCEAITVSDGGVQEIKTLTSSSLPELALENTQSSGNQPGETQEPNGGSDTLPLTTYSTGSLSLQVPQGWNVETGGDYICPYVKVSCPESPGLQFFFFSCLSPLFRNENERYMWSLYDATGLYQYAPILEEANAEGVVEIWEEITEFQMIAEKRELFPVLGNIAVIDDAYYQSLYSMYLGTVDSVCKASCSTKYDTDCILIAGTSITGAGMNQYTGSLPYCLLGTTGVIGTEEQLELYLDDMLACLKTLRFSQTSIVQSAQNGLYALPNEGEMELIMDCISKAVMDIYR